MTDQAQIQEQLEELTMIQRVDQELTGTPNIDNAMMLTMDWALRRTGANRGIVATVDNEAHGLVPMIKIGYHQGELKFNAGNAIPFDHGMIGRAVRGHGSVVINWNNDPTTAYEEVGFIAPNARSGLVVPIEMRGLLLGVIALESSSVEQFKERERQFVERLAKRAAVVLDNNRLQMETERRADEMAALYTASRTISSSIERKDVLSNAAQAVAALFHMPAVFIADHRTGARSLSVQTTYKLGNAKGSPDTPPAVRSEIVLQDLPDLDKVLRDYQKLAVVRSDPKLSEGMRTWLESLNTQTLIAIPLMQNNQLIAVIFATEGRRERRLTGNELGVADALSSQIASALRQAKLYEDVRELENLKSEMIRMASHDLRNPLGNVMGYLELLLTTFDTDDIHPDRDEYVLHIRQSLGTMRSLIEDLLTLERIESERSTSWTEFDLSKLVDEVVISQMGGAAQKRQILNLKLEAPNIQYIGSSTQLRQAMVNFINNAVKYTPEGGTIDVRFWLDTDTHRIWFDVQDNGYGISKERQARLFQRFYRAREMGTDHIPGTGLGLSLVKTVIERHGGDVFVESERGKGSTFGWWLPQQVTQGEVQPTTALATNS